MTSLQGPGRQNSPEPFADITERLRTMQGELNDVASSLLRSAGISVSPEGMTVDRALSILGTLDVSGDLDVTGGATFSGDMRIEGTLSLPAGIIDNDALANPLETKDIFATTSGFDFTTSEQTRATHTIAVPAGFNRFTLTGSGTIRGINPTASPQYIFTQMHSEVVGGGHFWGPTAQVTLPAGYQGTTTAPHSATIPVPPGATQVRAWLVLWSSAALAAHFGNFATVEGVAIFSRGT